MPITKHFQDRVEILDTILGGVRRYDKEGLLNRLNQSLTLAGKPEISDRTLSNDIRYLKVEKNAPLHTPEPGDALYYYTRRFSIKEMPFTEEEVDHLREATEILKKAMPHMLSNELEQLVAKLEHRIATNTEDRPEIIQFEQHTQASGSQWIEPLFSAIRARATLRVSYKPYHHPEAAERIFSPYLLKEFRSRWFVLGRYEDLPMVTNLALDRIVSIRNSSAPYVKNDILDPTAYFDHLVGVSIPPESTVQDVMIRVASGQAPYVLTKPIHFKQEIVSRGEDGSLMLRIPLHVNYELKSALLSYGHDIEVVAPEGLRTELSRVFREAAGMYATK
jgi:predicted DNA-binding transcriptional regulator YafY